MDRWGARILVKKGRFSRKKYVYLVGLALISNRFSRNILAKLEHLLFRLQSCFKKGE